MSATAGPIVGPSPQPSPLPIPTPLPRPRPIPSPLPPIPRPIPRPPDNLAVCIIDKLIKIAPPEIARRIDEDFLSWGTRARFISPQILFGDNIQRIILSPIGIIHLYRQYFFEFDTFLGPPAGHIWISPGGTVELFETTRRRTLTEQEIMATTEIRTLSEVAATTQEELSTAVKEDNSRNENLGVTVNTGGGFPGIFHADASLEYGIQTTNQRSQETTHKHMRQQSEKLSSEIKRSFQTTFRTTVETEDVTTRRHVIQNSTAELKNYELRRKMRRLGIQVQHIGTELGWQMYIDEPGRDLGVAELVHIAKPADLSGGLTPPEQPQPPKPIEQEITIEFPWMWDNATPPTDLNKLYVEGANNRAYGTGGTAVINTKIYEVAPPGFEYRLSGISQYSVQRTGENMPIAEPEFVLQPPTDPGSLNDRGVASFQVRMKRIHFADNPSVVLRIKLVWTTKFSLDENAYKDKMKEYNAEVSRRTKEAYINAVKERITLASKIQKRPSEDLRKEERIVVYRKLIAKLTGTKEKELEFNSTQTSHKKYHVMAELIRAIFDIDKMLYFVAPDWWLPRGRERMQQVIKPEETTPLTGDDLVGWGGLNQRERDSNYLITEDSEPAELGSSIGWLLQLDGDEHRNAFLNSPWVKAVIPIRPGMELQAINWLQQDDIEGPEGLDAEYIGEDKDRFDNPNGGKLKISDVIDQIRQELETMNKDPENISETDKVFEEGFDPLEEGFKWKGQNFKVFDQWLEILPTDQVVAVDYKPEDHMGQ
jgi:hypothetical protein